MALPLSNPHTKRYPTRLVLWSALLVILFVVLSSLGEVDPDKALLKQFFTTRGPVPSPSDITLVAISRTDLAPPLSLSPKYRIEPSRFENLLSRILEATPRQVFVDSAVLPERDDSADYERVSLLLKDSKVQVYEEELRLTAEPYLVRFLRSHDRHRGEARTAPIVLTGETVMRIPPATSLSSVEQGGPGVINLYGPVRTLPALTFSALLSAEPPDLSHLTDGTIFIGRQTSVFIRGQVATKFHSTLMGKEETSSLELQATIFANLRDGTAIELLPKSTLYLALIGVAVVATLTMLVNYWAAIVLFLALEAALITTLYLGFVHGLWWLEGGSLLPVVLFAFFVVGSCMTLFGTDSTDRETKKIHFLD